MTRAAIILVALLALSACGKRGELERPGPMWAPAPVNPAQ